MCYIHFKHNLVHGLGTLASNRSGILAGILFGTLAGILPSILAGTRASTLAVYYLLH